MLPTVPTLVTKPVVVTVATCVLSMVHVAICVTSSVPLPSVTNAVICCVLGTEIVCNETEDGVTVTPLTDVATTITVAEPV